MIFEMKNENRLIIGIIVVTSCIMALLYSPWGSPGNYMEDNSYGFRNGVNFSSRIENAPRIELSNSSGYAESSVPYAESGYMQLRSDLNSSAGVATPETHLTTNYKVNSQGSKNKISVTSSSNAGFVATAVYNVTKAQSKNNNYSNSTSIPVLGMVSFANISNGKNEINVSNLTNVSTISNVSKNTESDENKKQGFASLTTDLSKTDGSELITGPLKLDGESNPGDPGSLGYTDPGTDPSGDPVPVGDGFWILLVLLVGYAGWKLKAS